MAERRHVAAKSIVKCKRNIGGIRNVCNRKCSVSLFTYRNDDDGGVTAYHGEMLKSMKKSGQRKCNESREAEESDYR